MASGGAYVRAFVHSIAHLHPALQRYHARRHVVIGSLESTRLHAGVHCTLQKMGILDTLLFEDRRPHVLGRPTRQSRVCSYRRFRFTSTAFRFAQ